MSDVRFTVNNHYFVYDAQKGQSTNKSMASALKLPHLFFWISCALIF
jgi:hypothetical protein